VAAPKPSSFLSREHVVVGLPPGDRDEVLREFVDRLVAQGAFDAAAATTVLRAVLKRERVGSTGVGRGIAIPTPRRRGHRTDRGVRAAGVAIPYGATDGADVHSLFLVVSPADAASTTSRSSGGSRRSRAPTTTPTSCATRRTPTASTRSSSSRTVRPSPRGGHCRRGSRRRQRAGMHLRPATEFARLALATGCAVRVRAGDLEANGGSVLELAMMAVGAGTTLVISPKARMPRGPCARSPNSSATTSSAEVPRGTRVSRLLANFGQPTGPPGARGGGSARIAEALRAGAVRWTEGDVCPLVLVRAARGAARPSGPRVPGVALSRP